MIISIPLTWRNEFQRSKHNGEYFIFVIPKWIVAKPCFFQLLFFINRSQPKLLRSKEVPENGAAMQH